MANAHTNHKKSKRFWILSIWQITGPVLPSPVHLSELKKIPESQVSHRNVLGMSLLVDHKNCHFSITKQRFCLCSRARVHFLICFNRSLIIMAIQGLIQENRTICFLITKYHSDLMRLGMRCTESIPSGLLVSGHKNYGTTVTYPNRNSAEPTYSEPEVSSNAAFLSC